MRDGLKLITLFLSSNLCAVGPNGFVLRETTLHVLRFFEGRRAKVNYHIFNIKLEAGCCFKCVLIAHLFFSFERRKVCCRTQMPSYLGILIDMAVKLFGHAILSIVDLLGP